MVAAITIPGMFLTGTHAARPAATAVGGGTLYSCSTHNLIYQSDGAAWTTWATLAGGISDGYGAGYDPDRPPTSGTNAATDEFDDSSLHADWTWTTAPGGTVSESAYPGLLHIDGGTNASSGTLYLRRAYVPGAAAAFSVAAKCRTAMENGNFSQQIGIALLTSADAIIAQLLIASDGTATGAKNHRLFFGASAATQFAGAEVFDMPIAAAPEYLLITRDASDVYRFYFGWDGTTWQYMGTITSATAVAKVALQYAADTDAVGEMGWWGFLRVFTSETKKIGS